SEQRNAWHHYALVYDGSFVSLYWDGIQIGSQPRSGNLDSGTTPLTFGWGSYLASHYHLKGVIDEIRVFSRALTADEIAVLALDTPGLILSYNMEKLTADGRMEDLSGNGHHGTIVGTTAVSGKVGGARQFNGTSD